LSHRSAAALWGLLPDDSERLHVIAGQRFRSTAEIRAHCCSLASIEVTDRLGIPVSSLARTLIDVAGTAPHLLERACNEAEVKRLITAEQISATIEINRGRRGVARLRALAETVDGAPPRSELERRFLALVAREGLPRPETGVLIEIGNQLLECDCVWREQRLIVELDGRKYHDTAIAFERDRVRDRLLLAAGWHVVRVTWSQVRDAGALLADLRRLLRHRRTQH
jgi:Protein of unknown function (DUF559)